MENIIKRLKRINGQVLGVSKMIDKDDDCEDIIIQFKATKSAFDSAYAEVLQKSLEKCLKKNDQKKLKRIVKLISKN